MNGLLAYNWYISLKTHFTTAKYDIIQKGLISVTQAQYDKKGGVKYAIERLIRKYTASDLNWYFIANFLSGDKYGGLFNVDGKTIYADFIRRKESMSYLYEQDLMKITDGVVDEYADDSPLDVPMARKYITTCLGGKHPNILVQYLGKHIMLETLVILEREYKYKALLDETLKDDPVWKDTSRLLGKAIPFVEADSGHSAITKRYFF